MDIRVAVFEDNKLVRDAMKEILNESPGFVCTGSFPNGEDWESDIRNSNPHVILMDIEMPGINGIELTKKIRSHFPDIKILAQTVFNDNDRIFHMLCNGASGYLLKTDPPSRYLDAVREVYNGGAAINTAIAKKILGFFSNSNVILVEPSNHDYQISDREKEILNHMVKGLDSKAIAAKLFISYETVRTHVKHIYKKLHVASRNEAVMKAIQKRLI
ncbi:MAG: response regulator transcription factor [Chitinophagaceae bacterium]|nr:response regulator transcription factor [Chitinophagaceae bacterium]